MIGVSGRGDDDTDVSLESSLSLSPGDPVCTQDRADGDFDMSPWRPIGDVAGGEETDRDRISPCFNAREWYNKAIQTVQMKMSSEDGPQVLGTKH